MKNNLQFFEESDPAPINPTNGEKTFTQEDVNRIIGERLAKERSKSEQELSKREKELQQREMRLTAKEMLSARGLSQDLADALNCADKETLEKSISIVEKIFNENKEEASKPIFTSKKPYMGVTASPIHSEDTAIRKAMGLLK